MLMHFLLLNLTINIFYGSETVQNVFLKMYLLFLIRFKKMQFAVLSIEVWKLILTYLPFNDLIEIWCVCKDFYHLCTDNRFYFEKRNQSKRIFRVTSWLLFCHYKKLCENFYYSLFRKLVTYFSLLPFRVWNHLFHCYRSQYESNLCLFKG